MKIIFYASDKPHEQSVAHAFADGVPNVEVRPIPPEADLVNPDGDMAVVIGLKGGKTIQAYQEAGKLFMQLDKGYSRMSHPNYPKTEFWRCAINASQPTSYLFNDPLPDDRWQVLAKNYRHKLRARNENGDRCLYFSSSERYHYWHGLPKMNDYARATIRSISKVFDGPIVYCPKIQEYGKGNVQNIPGTLIRGDRDRIHDLVKGAFVGVVHGSGACVELIMRGVPVVVLGDAITKPICSTRLKDVANPMWFSNALREQWAANFAYSQFTIEEMADGTFWSFQKQCLDRYFS